MFVVHRRDPVCLKVVNLFLEKCHEVHLIASSFQRQKISYHRSYIYTHLTCRLPPNLYIIARVDGVATEMQKCAILRSQV